LCHPGDGSKRPSVFYLWVCPSPFPGRRPFDAVTFLETPNQPSAFFFSESPPRAECSREILSVVDSDYDQSFAPPKLFYHTPSRTCGSVFFCLPLDPPSPRGFFYMESFSIALLLLFDSHPFCSLSGIDVGLSPEPIYSVGDFNGLVGGQLAPHFLMVFTRCVLWPPPGTLTPRGIPFFDRFFFAAAFPTKKFSPRATNGFHLKTPLFMPPDGFFQVAALFFRGSLCLSFRSRGLFIVVRFSGTPLGSQFFPPSADWGPSFFPSSIALQPCFVPPSGCVLFRVLPPPGLDCFAVPIPVFRVGIESFPVFLPGRRLGRVSSATELGLC